MTQSGRVARMLFLCIPSFFVSALDAPRPAAAPALLVERQIPSGRVEQVTGIDGTVDIVEVSADGKWTRATTIYNGLTFTATRTPDEIRIPGFPALELRYRGDGRLVGVASADGELISFEYQGGLRAGAVARIRINGESTLQFKELPNGNSRQTLKGRDGKVLREEVAPLIGGRRPETPVELDIIRHELGLPDDWANAHHGTFNASGTVVAIRHGDEPDLAYVWRFEDLVVVYDLSGHPLLMQVELGPLVQDLLGSGVPTRFVLTPDGRAGVHTDMPRIRGVEGFWTPADRRAVEYRTISDPHEATSRGVTTNLMYICDTTSVSYTIGDTTYTTITNYWCDGGGGGGGGTWDGGYTEPQPSGGTTTTTTTSYANNKITNDAILKDKVNKAIGNAKTKLQQAACADVLTKFTATGGTYSGKRLDEALAATGASDVTTYLTTYVQFYNGTYESGCTNSSTAVAFVSPVGGRVIRVCKRFSNLLPSVAGNRMIHEMLHTLGLGENPPSDAEIDGAISQACGN